MISSLELRQYASIVSAEVGNFHQVNSRLLSRGSALRTSLNCNATIRKNNCHAMHIPIPPFTTHCCLIHLAQNLRQECVMLIAAASDCWRRHEHTRFVEFLEIFDL
jgi:hypothetical protein